ncbi:type II toxin-antitoxin system HipA family toxin [Streptomyces sp. NBC_00448]|uniref:type II toxin-antitoxin system HipA family toxin n=1 Tax=Streptomyces sp. NBC_00448 TaxID=2903652 RepID=UPI002E213135
MRETQYAVWLRDRHVGVLHQRGDYTRMTFDVSYREDPDRPVLGLHFEETLLADQASALRLPPWFSNLLPEGRIREWVAEDRGVSVDREMELLAHMGHDLPGAVRVLPADVPIDRTAWEMSALTGMQSPEVSDWHPGWRISLAGVQLKFAVLAKDDRFTVPGYGDGSDWIVKLPDRQFENLPANEHAVMSLARESGIEVPDTRLVHRDELDGIPVNVWPSDEEFAYAVKRFDRTATRGLVHIEDLAQVRNFYPGDKYRGNFETLASLIYRSHDLESLREFARRLTFIILVNNGDAHLKNWSLIYHDPRRPRLAPAYDLVSTAVYRVGEGPEDLGLKFGGTKAFERVRFATFRRLEERLGAVGADLAGEAERTVTRTLAAWEQHADSLGVSRELRKEIDAALSIRASSLAKIH